LRQAVVGVPNIELVLSDDSGREEKKEEQETQAD
jgi:hypothetical protein